MTEVLDAPPGARTPEACLSPGFQKRLLTTGEAARYIQAMFGVRCRASTLKKMRHTGGGPAFRRFGRDVLYERTALDVWAEGRLSAPLTSTSAD